MQFHAVPPLPPRKELSTQRLDKSCMVTNRNVPAVIKIIRMTRMSRDSRTGKGGNLLVLPTSWNPITQSAKSKFVTVSIEV